MPGTEGALGLCQRPTWAPRMWVDLEMCLSGQFAGSTHTAEPQTGELPAGLHLSKHLLPSVAGRQQLDSLMGALGKAKTPSK